MKEMVIISGKGGTGKTSLTAAFATLANNFVLADCDVDAADLHLVLQPKVRQQGNFIGGKQASINSQKCLGCGKCAQMCRFDAIHFDESPGNSERKYAVDPVSCEGCKVCVTFCPVGAIEFNDAINGQWYISDTRFGPMVHAKLGIAEENSGKLVTLIRKKAGQIASLKKKDMIIVDGSPGIGCPVIASITGADLVLIVTEPTLSGLHDLKRVAKLTSNFGIKTMLCVNKADINLEMTEKISEYAENNNLKLIGKIPYDEAFTKAQVMRATLIEYTRGSISEMVKSIWRKTVYALG